MAHIGKAPLTLVPTLDGTMHYVYAGRPAPQGIVPADLKRLVDEDFLVKVADVEDPPPVEDPLAVVVTADGVEHVGELPATAERPAQAANKDAWVDFAVSQGADRDEAEAKTKAELIAAYGA